MLNINIYSNKKETGEAAAEKAAEFLLKALDSQDYAYFVAATGVSQYEFLDALTKNKEIEWSRTVMFHLDEYIGLSTSHPGSLRNYLQKRIVNLVPLGKVHFIEGDALDALQECNRINKIVSQIKIDVIFLGVGENGHLAFNEPPANFEIKDPYIIVDLDQKSRNQQIREGWFDSIEQVPKKAISMSIQEIMRGKNIICICIICICPERRKAEAVRNCFSENARITPKNPASILKKHESCYCFLDKQSASLLKTPKTW
jgi:glucosamine-6-phosphate deaminase